MKPPIHELFRLFPNAIEAIAILLAESNKKHHPCAGDIQWDWETHNYASICRHVLAWAGDLESDSEPKKHHIAAIALRALAELENYS